MPGNGDWLQIIILLNLSTEDDKSSGNGGVSS